MDWRQLPHARAAMYQRISSSRPAHPICAFAGGALPHTILSACSATLLGFLGTRSVLPLRATCREAASATARHPFEDHLTPLRGSVAAWRACFPSARVVNASRAHRRTPLALSDLEHLRGLQAIKLCGASAKVVAAVRAAAPHARLTGLRRAGAVLASAPNSLASGLVLVPTPEGLLLMCGGRYSEQLRVWLFSEPAALHLLHRTAAYSGGTLASLGAEHPCCFASAADDTGAISMWHAPSFTRLHELEGRHSSHITCLAALPDGLLAIGGRDGTLVLRVAASGKHVATLLDPTQSVLSACIYSLAVVQGGRVLVTGGIDGQLRLWCLRTHKLLGRLQHVHEGSKPRVPGEAVYGLAALWGGVGGALASASGSEVFLWVRGGGVLLAAVQPRVAAPRPLPSTCGAPSFSRTRQLDPPTRPARARTAASQDTIHGVQETVLRGHRGDVFAMLALPEGLLASGSSDGCVRVWDIAGAACVAVLECVMQVQALVRLPSGHLVSLSAGGMGELRVWELEKE